VQDISIKTSFPVDYEPYSDYNKKKNKLEIGEIILNNIKKVKSIKHLQGTFSENPSKKYLKVAYSI
jgi:hypothetical protein